MVMPLMGMTAAVVEAKPVNSTPAMPHSEIADLSLLNLPFSYRKFPPVLPSLEWGVAGVPLMGVAAAEVEAFLIDTAPK